MWNGNQQQQPPPPPPPQYASQISTRLDFTNQIQQRIPPRQSSPSSSQYSQTITNNNNNAYSSNPTVTTNDRWINLPWTDPAIISFGNKLDPTP